MRTVMDIIMSLGFVLFMVWIIKGYHANKYEERYGENGTEVKRRKKEEKE
ncbi:hypothetical protein [Hydrogenimonas sp.]|nr:hypothetical protein [Hydrogenimonas sp.]